MLVPAPRADISTPEAAPNSGLQAKVAMRDLASIRSALKGIPRLGWVDEPSPITALPTLAARLECGWIGAKRDDQLHSLLGGTKVRKLDTLLATETLIGAESWVSTGAIGSGHMVTLAAAAERLERPLDAVLFWQSTSEEVHESLSYVASRTRSISYHDTRPGLFLRHPGKVFGISRGGRVAIPPGASSAAGMAGLVFGAFELADQIASGALPMPHRIVVPLGTGGTAVGLAVGLKLAGLGCKVHAVAVTERWITPRFNLGILEHALSKWLSERGVHTERSALSSIEIDRSQVGAGYAKTTPASVAATEKLRDLGIPMEPIYSGKAMAAVLAGIQDKAENILFWVTPRRDERLPQDPNWEARLPDRLARRIRGSGGPMLTRRRLLLGSVGLAVAGMWLRFGGYPALPGWQGKVLASWEAQVVEASAEALMAPHGDPEVVRGVAANVERYLTTFSEPLLDEVHLLIAAVEHGATPTGIRFTRLTRLSLEDRIRWFDEMGAYGGLRGEIYQGIRGLVMLGYYQEPASWEALGYEGPMVGSTRRPTPYDALAAPKGTLPLGLRREGV